MNEIEQDFKELFEKIYAPSGGNAKLDYLEEDKLQEQLWEEKFRLLLKQEPANPISSDFILWLKSTNYKNLSCPIKKIDLWILIYDYQNTEFEEEKKVYLEQIQKLLISLTECDKKKSGEGILDSDIADGDIVRNVYLSEDEDLINLFSQILPRPSPSLFLSYSLPKVIAQHQSDGCGSIENIVRKNANSIKTVENAVIPLQRLLKSQKRREEIHDLVVRSIIVGLDSSREELSEEELSKIEKDAIKMIEDADVVYKPKESVCPKELSDRIFRIAKTIKLFSTIRHLTSSSSLRSILDDGLFGRKSLLRNYKSFRPAALDMSDMYNGDSDAICFGAFDIDEACMKDNTVEFILGIDELRESKNPCIFFKQRDLGYSEKKIRTVEIGNRSINFSHTVIPRCSIPEHKVMEFYRDREGRDMNAFSEVHKFYLISSNLEEMDQILIMNFFRFLDKVISPYRRKYESFASDIYKTMEQLSDEELKSVLFDIGRSVSDTMEFNFYQSFLIDPDLIKEIKFYSKANILDFCLNMGEFIESLNEGNLVAMDEAKEKLPELFESYRFVDYLISKVNNDNAVKKELSRIREEEIKLPIWRAFLESANLTNASSSVLSDR